MSRDDSKASILLVEDNDGHAFLIENALGRYGGIDCVQRVNDAREALDFLRCTGRHETRPRMNPLLIILDLELPGMDGFEFLRELRGSAEFKAVPVFVVTALANSDNMVRCHELGCHACFSKWDVFLYFDHFVQMVSWITSLGRVPDSLVPASAGMPADADCV